MIFERQIVIMAKKKRTNAKKTQHTKNVKRKTKNNKDYFMTHLVVSALVSLFLALFMYTGKNAILSGFIADIMLYIFGVSAYIIPVSLALTTVYLIYTHSTKEYWKKFLLAFLAIINISSIIHLSTATSFDSVLTSCGNGGVVGAAISILLVKLVQTTASYILLILTLILLLGAIAGISTIKATVVYIKRFFVWFKSIYGDFSDKYSYEEEYDEYNENEYYENKKAKKIKNKKKPISKKASSPSPLDAANEFANDAKKGLIIKTDDFDEEPQTEITSNGIDEIFGKLETDKNIKGNTVDEPANDEEVKEREKNMTTEEKVKYNKEFNKAIEKEHIPYTFPPINLLNKSEPTSADRRMELRGTAEKLISVLDSFGVKAKLLQVTQGPAVTRYEIQPDVGVKLSKISSLADDIALNLAVSTVLVAPVPGKAAVGIEIPNNKVSSVGIREILNSEEFKNSKSKLTFALGKDIGGSVVIGDISRMPHLLIAGATGSGKSVCINTIIMSLLYKASPDDVKLIMVDPKVVELGVYNGIPHLLVPVVTDPKKAAGALNWAVTEMMRRYDLFKETGVRKLESYNKLMQSTGGETVPQLVIIIDELADLMMVAAKEVEDYICRIAQLARAAGIHLIIATQRPSVDVITGLIKANIPSRIAFAVSSQVDSRTILDKGGAEKLLGMGDMLFSPTYEREARRVQGAFVSDSEIENILTFIKEHSGGENHYSEDLAEQIDRCARGENGVTPDTEDDGDALLPDAISLALELGKISTSMVQRRLGVGYSRAGRIIDQMEARGIISGANGSKPRDVLISHADIPLQNEDEEDYEEE